MAIFNPFIPIPGYQHKKPPWFNFPNGREVDHLVAHIAHMARDGDGFYRFANDLRYNTERLRREGVWGPAETSMWEYSRDDFALGLGSEVVEWVEHFARSLRMAPSDSRAFRIEGNLSRPLMALTLYSEAVDMLYMEPDALKVFVAGGIPAAVLTYPLVDALYRHKSRSRHGEHNT